MSALADRIRDFIEAHADGTRDDAGRDALLAELSAQQAAHVEPYRRYLAAEARRPRAFALPALPTDVFRFARVASHPAREDVRTFRTSGTSAEARGEHHFCDLSLYDRAAFAAARFALFPAPARLSLCILAPRETELFDSSLSYMLARFSEWFGLETHYAWRDGQLDLDTLERALTCAREPIALLGTSFAFVHADAALGDRRFALPRGSRIMQTGGFKGRSRTVEPDDMLELLRARYGVERAFIVQEYGMTELSSQLYETPLRAACLGRAESPRRLWVPSWARAEPIDPDTLEPTRGEAAGLLRIDDLANLDSVCAIQTSDLAQRCEDGVIVLGRAPDAVARGCSLAVDRWLERSHA
ncbi:MAG TPA: acyl-protein synthetase [Polyangiales bacterium]|jgi:hypothetical protein